MCMRVTMDMIASIRTLCSIIVLLVGVATAVPFRNCGSPGAVISRVTVKPCGTGSRCELIKGTNVTFAIDFVAQEQTSSVRTVVYGILHGFPVPFPLPSNDACQVGHLSCPVKVKSRQHYQQSLWVSPQYPSLSLTVKWELQDADGNNLVCVLVPVQIKTQTGRSWIDVVWPEYLPLSPRKN